MQLTRAADYAVRVMIHLASQPEQNSHLQNSARKSDGGARKLSFQDPSGTCPGGMIRARRGVVGGFSLLPRGAQASLLDVVESIDGPIALNLCLTSDKSCNRHVECAVHEVWLRAQSAMLSVLREAKIAEMVPASGVQSALLNIAEVNRGGEQESTQAFSECLPQSSTKARTQFGCRRRDAQHTQEKI